MIKHINNRGFTIVETLVAITVLMIAIAGPLVVASKGLTSANLSKNQMIASYLVQESMEVIKNTRDNNIYNGTADWLNGLRSCTNLSPCDASAIDGSGLNPSIGGCGSLPCQLYIEANGYGHVAGSNQASLFTRKFFIHDATHVAPDITDCPLVADECAVTVGVYWNEASLPYSVVLTSEVTNTPR